MSRRQQVVCACTNGFLCGLLVVLVVVLGIGGAL
jgi:hypothetical protein